MPLDRRRLWKRIRIVWIAFAVLAPILMLLGFEAAYLPPNTLVSDDRVEIVLGRETFDFRPRPDDASRAGLIFLPGGMVEPESYAPMARAVAERGHYAVIVRLPFRVAPTPAYQSLVFETVLATMAASPRRWVVGGHSRGGMIATKFAAAYPGRTGGLALVATTHPRDVDLSGLPLCVPVVRVFGTRDNIASLSRARRDFVPPHTAYVEVQGGNHRQFGYYRYQLLDGGAAISREEQHRQLLDALMLVLEPSTQSGAPLPACRP